MKKTLLAVVLTLALSTSFAKGVSVSAHVAPTHVSNPVVVKVPNPVVVKAPVVESIATKKPVITPVIVPHAAAPVTAASRSLNK